MERSVAIGMLLTFISFGTLALSDSVAVPEACTPVVTIEKSNCVATTIFECESDYQEHGYQNGNLIDTHLFDKNWALAGYRFRNDIQVVDVQFDQGHSITLAELVKTGAGTTDRVALISTGRIKDREYRLQSEASLSGEEVDLNGYKFLVGKLKRQMKLATGSNTLVFDFEVFLSPELNLFVEGSHSRQTLGSDPEFVEQTPVSLRFPGQPGFLENMLEAGCNG